jgi:pilus assembly protein Flp/PilA
MGVGGKGVTMFTRMSVWLQTRLRKEEGATAVEYALMVALIAVVIIGAVTLLGNNASTSFDTTAQAIGGAS